MAYGRLTERCPVPCACALSGLGRWLSFALFALVAVYPVFMKAWKMSPLRCDMTIEYCQPLAAASMSCRLSLRFSFSFLRMLRRWVSTLRRVLGFAGGEWCTIWEQRYLHNMFCFVVYQVNCISGLFGTIYSYLHFARTAFLWKGDMVNGAPEAIVCFKSFPVRRYARREYQLIRFLFQSQ